MPRVFLSHSTNDDHVVAEIRKALERNGVEIWADSRRLTGGDPLDPKIKKAIKSSDYVIALLSPAAVNSPWVRKEIQLGLKAKKKIVPILLDGIEPSALGLWFDKEPVALKLRPGPGGIAELLPDLLAALGLRFPTDPQPRQQPPPTPMADLVLELSDPTIEKERAAATAQLTYHPPDGSPKVESRRYRFTAPIGPIESGELAWYLESYPRWPGAAFQDRARQVEKDLPEWGRLLYQALIVEAVRQPLEAWRAPVPADRRFTVLVDPDLPDGADDLRQRQAREAATLILALPWELVHDDRGYLFLGAHPVRVRRRLPNRYRQDPLVTKPPIRVLLVSPRPEDAHAAYLDHRASARPLVEALSALGDLAEFKLLSPPTFPALAAELQRQTYHVVHFDGHGVYRRDHGLGALCFEHPADSGKLDRRRSELIDADTLAQTIRDHRVPLFFLEACQTAQATLDPAASVAARLLQSGVASVVAMSHSVLVETARRFVTAFYPALLAGRRVGQAMLAGQQALQSDPSRGRIFTEDLRLQDWFVPVLFQEENDPQLIVETPAEQVQAQTAKTRRRDLGHLPDPPPHTFVGRSREMLHAERLLENGRERYVVLRGDGGEGKTTLAAELARWVVATRRFARAAFASLEHIANARAVLYDLGEQLVPGFGSQAGGNDDRARQLVERALEDEPVVVILDNFESVLQAGPDDDVLKLASSLARIGRLHQP